MDKVSPLVAAAHDLKSPLALIGGLAADLLDGNLTDAQQKEQIERILLSSDRMLHLVQGLVDVYRLEQSTLELPLEPVDIRQLSEEVAHELYPIAKKHNQKIAVQMGRRAHLVVANRLLLQETLLNLTDNALRHNRGDQVVVKSHVQKEFTRLAVVSEGQRLRLQEFNQLAARLGSQQPLSAYPGTGGLGLFIAQHFVRAMGGKIGVQRPQNGTGIYVDLFTSAQLQLI